MQAWEYTISDFTRLKGGGFRSLSGLGQEMPNVACSSGSPRGEAEELVAGACVVADESVQRRGDRHGTRLLDASHRHAKVFGLEHDADPLGSELFLKPARDLDCESLLQLQPVCEVLNDAG